MLWAGITVLMALAADPAPVQAYATLNPPLITYLQDARFSVVVETPNDIEPNLPGPALVDQFKKIGLDVADMHRDVAPLKKNRRRITETYTLRPYLPDNYRIAPFDVTWGDSNSAVIPSLALKVRELTDDEKKAMPPLDDAASAVPVLPAKAMAHLPLIIVLVLAAAALATAAILYFRRKREKTEPPPPAPWDVAYRRLRELDQRQWPKAEKYEPYYVDLSAILRYYIEDRFLVHAPEQTTQEFLATASVGGLFSEQQEQLVAGFLKHCDRVKFAQYVPTLAEMEHCFSVVLQFVDETVPKPEAETAAAAPEAAV